MRRQLACKESQAGNGGQGTRGAHIEHVAHGCDAGRVEAQRLVERRRALPSQQRACEEARMQGEARTGDGRVWGDVRRQVACKESQAGDGGQGTRGAHIEHVAHVCDAGRVEAQRLVELISVLPSRKEAIPLGASCGPEGGRAVRWRRREQRARRRVGLHAMERTLNM